MTRTGQPSSAFDKTPRAAVVSKSSWSEVDEVTRLRRDQDGCFRAHVNGLLVTKVRRAEVVNTDRQPF